MTVVEQLRLALAEPFAPEAIQWKPQSVKEGRCLAIAYIDARDVADRLDDVVGIDGWQDEYEPLPDGSVMCKLHVRLGDAWITKADVGSESEQPDSGDRRKSAFSDALKRAAVKFGIGRFLYSFPAIWVDYDPRTRRVVTPPVVPVELLPGYTRLQAARTPEELRTVWESIPNRPWKQALLSVKDARKVQLVALRPATASTGPASAPPPPAGRQPAPPPPAADDHEEHAAMLYELEQLCQSIKVHPVDLFRRNCVQLGFHNTEPLPPWQSLSVRRLRDLIGFAEQQARTARPVTA